MDIFQVLDICQSYADALIDYNNQAKYMALCGRLLAGLTILRVVLKNPLQEHLIQALAVNANEESDDCPSLTRD
ncbi:hypothetical protein [Dryocola clanedunensis]|uniref:hypothetical protein n=1 Tax=Cedecea sulfonylureivorans TaxID=3051154 RepID=UPI001925B203|nr:hypothetical protein [Cedecea sulfonylureivorans]